MACGRRVSQHDAGSALAITPKLDEHFIERTAHRFEVQYVQPREARWKPSWTLRKTWVLDYAAISRAGKGSLSICLYLSNIVSQPWFDRDKLCDQCHRWKPVNGLLTYPSRPGAIRPAGGEGEDKSCEGCWFALLNEGPPRPPNQHPGGKRRQLVIELPVTASLTDIQHTRTGIKLGQAEL
jgi:hypothetical protein